MEKKRLKRRFQAKDSPLSERKRVLLCQGIHPDAEALLEERFEVIRSPDPDEAVVRTLIEDVQGAIVRTRTTIGVETIKKASKLQVIGRTGVGVDNVDSNAATEAGILIVYTPEANTTTVAEHTIAFILFLAKQIPHMDRETRRGNFQERHACLSSDVAGKTIGLVGFGRIGRETARKASEAFDMRVLYYDPYLKDDADVSFKAERKHTLEEILRESDFVSLHLPANDNTRHLIDESKLRLMKPTAFLINTARGSIVDEEALARILGEKAIRGAALDVFEKEPPDGSNPFLALENVVVTPHCAALTGECMRRMAMDAARGVCDVLEGRTPRFVFNPEVLKKKG